MHAPDLLTALSRFTIFSELTPAQLTTIAEHCQSLHLARGQTLFNRGDAAQGLYLLQSGQIKLGITSPQGTEKVVSIVAPGDSFGEAVMFLERRFPVYAQATLDSSVMVVAKGAIFSLLDHDPLVARKMLAGLSIRMHQLVQDIEMLSLQSSSQRLIGYLLQFCADADGAGRVTLPASKSTVAALLNLTPETLSRTLTRLQQAGLIDVSGKEIAITDVARLRNHDLGL